MSKILSPSKPKKDKEAERRAEELRKQQMEEAAEKDSEIAEGRARIKRKAGGRTSLLKGSAAGVQSDTLG